MSLVGVSVGDTVRVLSERYDQPALVVKVGRTLATLSDGHQYEMATGTRKGVLRGWGYTAFSEQAMKQREARGDFRGAIARLYEVSRRADLAHMSIDELQSFVTQLAALEKRVENKNG